MARLKHLIKRFDFSEDVRRELTIGPDTRLNPETHKLQLKEGADGKFPTTADLFIKTRATNPGTLKKWVGFMADVTHGKICGVVKTDVRYRVADATQELYFNVGSQTWTVAAPNNWNTEEQVADNIDKFPVASQTIQVVINLSTSDARVTPQVSSVRFLYESDLDELQDYIWESLVPDLKAKIRPIGDHHIESTGAWTIGLANEFKIETPYTIVGIDAVYDLTADPRKLTDLLDSFDVGTQVVTLTSAPPATNTVLIRFFYQPNVPVTTGQDYVESEKVPEIILEGITQVAESHQHGRDFVINKRTGAGKKVIGTQSDIEIIGRWITNSAKDHARLGTEIRRYFRENVLLRSVGQDEQYRLWLLDEYDQQTSANRQDLHAGRFRCRIAKALFYDHDAVDIHGVLNFRLSMKQQAT